MMGEKRLTRKQITFDLSDKNLKLYYPHAKHTVNPNYHKKAWKDIAKFMSKNGFEHRQYSVYASKEVMTSAKINALMKMMVKTMPWLYKCLNAIDVTNIGQQHSLMSVVEKAAIKYEKERIKKSVI